MSTIIDDILKDIFGGKFALAPTKINLDSSVVAMRFLRPIVEIGPVGLKLAKVFAPHFKMPSDLSS